MGLQAGMGCNRWDGGWIQVREEKVVKDEAAIRVGVERDTGVCGETDEMSLDQVVSQCLIVGVIWFGWICRSAWGMLLFIGVRIRRHSNRSWSWASKV